VNDGSDLLPDLVLLKPAAHRYRSQHPVAEDVLLIVEVADSSLGCDRHGKMPDYAAEGVPEVWVVNLRSDQMEVHRSPAGSDYRVKTIHTGREQIAPLAFPDLLLTAGDVLA
jgi:Uma2 family endonuclease